MNEVKYPFLASIKDDLDKCTKCASCQAGCPTYALTESETLVARGKIRLAQGMLNNELTLTDRIANDFTQCLSCMNCLTACPSGVNTMAIFDAMRQEIAMAKPVSPIQKFIFTYILPYPWRLNLLAKMVGVSTIFYRGAPSWIARFLPYSPNGVQRVTPNFLQRNLRSRLRVTTPSARDKAKPLRRVAFFTGCMTDLAFPATGKRVAEGLSKAGVEVIFPKEQLCCGAPAYFSGDIKTSKELARKNIDVFSALDVDAIVYSCATCGSVLGETYATLFPGDEKVKEMARKVIDYQKLLIELSLENILEGAEAGGRKVKVTYHDPCHLRRGMGVFREPRQLLKNLPAVEFVEMEGADSCCGGSGTFGLKYYDASMEQGKRKVDWIEQSGADMVITACPSCQFQLADALNRHASRTIPVLHTADLIDLSLSGKPFR